MAEDTMSTQQFVCSYLNCDKAFNKIKYLRRHQKIHTKLSEDQFGCPHEHCFKKFATQQLLKKHLKRPHSSPSKNGPYHCMFCSKEYRHKFDLKVHEAVHTGEKPLMCEKCGACFALRNRLKTHMKTHKVYKCSNTGCDHVCDKWTQLRKHVAENHKKKCPECSRRFLTDESLQKHISSHEFSIKCPHCDLTYSNKSNLKVHVRSVHEKVAFMCNYEGCGKELAHRKSLREHLKTHDKTATITSKVCQKRLVPKRRVVMAEVMSGMVADPEIKEELLLQDKEFRLKHEEFGREVVYVDDEVKNVDDDIIYQDYDPNLPYYIGDEEYDIIADYDYYDPREETGYAGEEECDPAAGDDQANQ